MDLHENFNREVSLDKEVPIKLWKIFGSESGSGSGSAVGLHSSSALVVIIIIIISRTCFTVDAIEYQ